MCNFHSARLPPSWPIKVKFRDRLCILTRFVRQLIMPGIRCQVCRLAKL